MTTYTSALTRRSILGSTIGAIGSGLLLPAGLGSRPAAAMVPAVGVDAPWHAKVDEAGFRHRRARVNGVRFSYREGPRNGPALVLLHAQQMDWFSYSRVLPTLAERFHVFDVDYQGHGATTTPATYPMNARRIGRDLATFIERVVRRPAFVTGNSSGGLLATWLAAYRPELVRAVVLEDPPLFASEYPRIKKTIAYRDFASSTKAVAQDVDDFLLFWIRDNREFFRKNIAPGSAAALSAAVVAERALRPGEPVEVDLVTNDMIRLFLRGMDHQYDPRFGRAFYRGTWNKPFDHATALARIPVRTMLVHANFHWIEGDILYGAMDDRDADRAMSHLRRGTFRRIDAEHVTHLDKPEEFVDVLRDHFRV